jgi:hypothetical protein
MVASRCFVMMPGFEGAKNAKSLNAPTCSILAPQFLSGICIYFCMLGANRRSLAFSESVTAGLWPAA